jgi:hypothetical protein
LPVIAGTKYIGVIWIRGEKYKKWNTYQTQKSLIGIED